MTEHAPPPNVRVVYPDGRIIRITNLWHWGEIQGQQVWVADNPHLFVPAAPGARVTHDGAADEYYVIVGFDRSRADGQDPNHTMDLH